MAANAKKNTTKTNEVVENIDNTNKEEVVIKENPTSSIKTTNKKVKPDLPLNMEVDVINGTYGELIYISKKNMGYEISWDGFGAVNTMELGELVAARNSDKRFFTENWWLFEDDDVVDYLGVGQYYQNSIRVDDFENLFTESAEDIEAKVSVMNEGLKRTIAARAYELIQDDQIYDNRVIKALEKSTGFDLTDK